MSVLPKLVNVTTLILFVTLFTLPAFARPSAATFVKKFYTQHFRFAERMYFSRENVRRERSWLTPRLYKLMLYELHRAKLNERDSDGNDLKGYINGDVFTDSESSPQVFRIGRAFERADAATVSVICYWNDASIGKMKRTVKIVLLAHGNSWLIDNVIDEDGLDLIKDLSRPNYFETPK